MSWMRISESKDWIVDYDKERGMYRVSYFEDNHFVDECFFDTYGDKEVDDRVEKIIKQFEYVKNCTMKRKRLWDSEMVCFLCDKFINWIKDLSKSP